MQSIEVFYLANTIQWNQEIVVATRLWQSWVPVLLENLVLATNVEDDYHLDYFLGQ